MGLVREDPKWCATTIEPVLKRAGEPQLLSLCLPGPVAITVVHGPPKLNPKQNLILFSI